MSVMSRTKAREIALHLIFEMEFQPFEDGDPGDRLDASIMQSLSTEVALYAGELDEEQTRYIRAAVKGVALHKAELNTAIETYAKGWKLNRLSRMTASILRLAIYEMRYVEDVPAGAAINEAVELAKVYDAEDAPAFINGVLGSLARAEAPKAKAENADA